MSDSIDNELNLVMSLAFMVLNINITTSEEKNIEKVQVLKTQSTWFGVTYVEDKPFVESQIKELVQRGEYPVSLF